MSALDRTRVPAPGPIRPLAFPRLERARLDNGLALLAALHGELPLVTVELIVEAGAAGDPLNKAGLAHLTVNALETGTATRSADEVAWSLERLGIELEADATWDVASIRITLPRQHLEPAMELFADLVLRPAFPEAEIERLRHEQLATILQRQKEPRALANDMAAHFIFAPDVPYARPLIGTAASVEGLTREDVRAFHRAHYLPNTASLLFVGDVDSEDARRVADRFFGAWPPGEPRTTTIEVVPRVESRTLFIVDRPGAVQSEIRIGDVGVERKHQDYFPLLVMNTILGGAFTSRLNLSLRERHGFTYGARSGFAFRRSPGPFLVQAAVATDVTAPAVREAMRELTLLHDEGATEQEVAAARDYLRGVLPLELQTTDQLASRLADLVIFDLPDDYFQQYRDRIAAVSREEVHRVARAHLRLDRLVITVVGDAARIAPELETLDLGEVKVHVVD